MSGKTTSTVAQLLFSTPPGLDFAGLVRDLTVSLADHRTAVTCESANIAWFDLGTAHLTLAYVIDLPGQFRASLTLAMGLKPQPPGASVPRSSDIALEHEAICRRIIDQIGARNGIDDILWRETDQPITAALIASLNDNLPQSPEAAIAAGWDDGEDDDLPDSVTTLKPPVIPATGSQLDRLLAQVDATLAARDAAPPPVLPGDVVDFAAPYVLRDAAPVANRTVSVRRPVRRPAPLVSTLPLANDLPDLPHPMVEETQRIRAALYAEDEAADQSHSTPLRLAAHTMTATLIVIALPVGAAMLTYTLFRGANINASARMMALTGIFMGFQQLPGALQVINTI